MLQEAEDFFRSSHLERGVNVSRGRFGARASIHPAQHGSNRSVHCAGWILNRDDADYDLRQHADVLLAVLIIYFLPFSELWLHGDRSF
jgi:hypothetical protein